MTLTARAHAAEIRKQYRASKTQEREYEKFRPKAYAEIQRLYGELRAVAQFVFRHNPSVSDEFEPLRTAVGIVTTKRGVKAEEKKPEGETKPEGEKKPEG